MLQSCWLKSYIGHLSHNRFVFFISILTPGSIHFVVVILFILTWLPDRAVLNGKNVLSTLVMSTKKRHSSFLKKVFVFQKICFKIKVLKTFETLTDCHIKTCQSLKRRPFSKIPSTFF